MRIHTEGSWFKDEQGRTLLLRGVNLAGNVKLPYPDGASHVREGFFDHHNVTFVNRPFPLEEADEHFRRLRSWGFYTLRFLVSWEAIEHEGPGIIDTAYLDYVRAIIEKAAEYDIQVFIDPHQDCWSRFSGGDGAPGWTFDTIGMDITKFQDTGAALVHQVYGDPFPRMIWFSNWLKFACSTMFTLFFGGNDFAPLTKVGDENIQDFLQRHYINAVKQLAIHLKGLPNVMGYDTMNEPVRGYIGWRDIRQLEDLMKMGDSPTPLQGMLLASGYPQSVEVWSQRVPGLLRVRSREVNTKRTSLWKEGFECVWRRNGVWDVDEQGDPFVIDPHYFSMFDNRSVDFNNDYLRPFIHRFSDEIRSVDPEAIIFIESMPEYPPPRWDESDPTNVVYAPHWYEGLTLFTKRFWNFFTVDNITLRPVTGKYNVQRAFDRQIGRFRQYSKDRLNDAPVLIGENGIPYDLQNSLAFRTGNFFLQNRALNLNMRAMETNLLSVTLWHYNPSNTNARGDGWNGEDFSVFSYDQQTNPDDINSGGRALKALVRPYPVRTAGVPLYLSYDMYKGIFEFAFRHDSDVDAPTEIYIPVFQFPDGYEVEVSDGEFEFDPEKQHLIYRHNLANVLHTIRITSNTLSEPERRLGRWVVLVSAIVLGFLFLRWFQTFRRNKPKPAIESRDHMNT